jgi:sulfite exporter TauE/SafE
MLLLFTSVHDAPPWFWLSAGGGMGIAGAAHCAGMCGAFPLSLAAVAANGGSRAARSALYNAGRGLTYVVLGLLAAGIGVALHQTTGIAEFGRTAAAVLSVAAGVMIALSALFLLGVRIPFIRTAHGGGIADKVAGLGRGIVRSKNPLAPVTLGVINGLLPCPLVYAMLASAFALGAMKAIGPAVLLAAGFAAGTIPVMAAIGLIGGPVFARYRTKLARVAGVFLLLFAALTIIRGLSPDALHDLIPASHDAHSGGHAPGDGLLVSGQHFDANGNLMQKPPDMAEEEYLKVIVQEEELAKRITRLLRKNDRAGLRALDAELTESLVKSGTTGLRCFTVTDDDIRAITADPNAPEKWDFRCVCCGTQKQERTERLGLLLGDLESTGRTLLLPADKPNPWKDPAAPTIPAPAEPAPAH